MHKVMVVAGTKDAREIIAALGKMNIEIVATVTTGYGKELIESGPGVEVVQGKLDAQAMKSLFREKGIRCVIDASHPFAIEASTNAICASNEYGIAYLRFERQSTVPTAKDRVLRVQSFEEAAVKANEVPGNIFLTVGSNHIRTFTARIHDYKGRLFARVLPDSRMIAKCEEAGLSAGNIVAMKGPFSMDMNIEMLKHCNTAVLVTKESGETGGTGEKLDAAEKLGIPVILVERPEMVYGKKVSTDSEVVQFVTQQLQKEMNL